MTEFVLDASALLASIKDEPGAEAVIAVLPRAVISAVNLSEVVAKLCDYGLSEEETREALGVIHLEVAAFDESLAYGAGELHRSTRRKGLSLGDRACLALAKQTGLPVLTTDRAWAGLDVGVEVRLIRD